MRRGKDEQRKEEIVGREKKLIKQAGHVAKDPNNKHVATTSTTDDDNLKI